MAIPDSGPFTWNRANALVRAGPRARTVHFRVVKNVVKHGKNAVSNVVKNAVNQI